MVLNMIVLFYLKVDKFSVILAFVICVGKIVII